METLYLEHANITYRDLDKAILFFHAAFPNFKVRGEGLTIADKKWVHFGTDTTYIALQESSTEKEYVRDYLSVGINHLAFVVKDISAIAKNLIEAGFKRDSPRREEEFRIREYFLDHEGNEYEFIQYLSEKAEEKNKY